ncbi:MAG: CoA transferase [Limnohabitans sp.]|jgi:crotonobetainyl-CoA:carnitine CoA-transferase CaiB-like acyl-CoA transferase|nr:CoA transferase [Limnohabitans sp.]
MALPLQGLRVLDLTNVLAGPYCSMVLGDMGADVIKVENTDKGDTSRNFEPQVNGESYCFAVLNRNKKSISLDLKSPEGKKIALALAERADIVLENFRPGVVKRMGLDYESIRARNPQVIYASMSGFGQTGPYGKKGGLDIIAQGMSGIMMMTGHPGGRPAKVGIAMNDIASGVTTLYGVLGALIGKLRHGEGQYLETSLLEAGMAWAVWEFGAFFGGGEVPTATGTRHRRSAPYQAYRTRDGYVTVGASSQKLWANFCEQVVGQPQWLQDPRFATQALRVRHADDLERDIEAVFAHQDTAHWVTLLDAASVPGGPVFGFETTLNDPHVKFRKMVHEIEHPRIGPMKTIGLPIKSSGALGEIRLPAPWLGQHSEEILQSLGYAEADIRALFDQGVVVDRYRPKN